MLDGKRPGKDVDEEEQIREQHDLGNKATEEIVEDTKVFPNLTGLARFNNGFLYAFQKLVK
jgi:hypothetical protein